MPPPPPHLKTSALNPEVIEHSLGENVQLSKSEIVAMDTLLRQSRSMCPFLNKTSPATLRTLSSSTAPARHVSPGGGTMSNLQMLARRCPVMGKAMAVQATKTGKCGLNGVFGGTRAYGGKAKIHTTRAQHASVADATLRREQQGTFILTPLDAIRQPNRSPDPPSRQSRHKPPSGSRYTWT